MCANIKRLSRREKALQLFKGHLEVEWSFATYNFPGYELLRTLAHTHDLLKRFARIDQVNPASCAVKLLDHSAHESNFHATRSVVSIGRDSNDARRRLSQIATPHVNRSRCVRACSSRVL